ncbi:MAG: ATP-binding protein [Rhodanobacteraceae bacterium]
MTLRRKLLAVALSTLALPFAGWLYVRQMEQLLRRSQEQALLATAFALGRGLVAVGANLPSPAKGWYVQNARQPIIVDGYGDDWAALSPWVQHPWPGVRVQLAQDAAWLYMHIEVNDATRTRVDAQDSESQDADHVELTLARGGRQRHFLVASAAPGSFQARPLDERVRGLPDLITGQWQEDAGAYRIELRLPRAQAPDHLGIAVYDADAPTRFDGGEPDTRPLYSLSPALSNDLTQLAPTGVRVRLLSSEGWVLASGGALASDMPASKDRMAWFDNLIFDALIAPALQPRSGTPLDAPQLQDAEVQRALAGRASAVWRAGEAPGSVVLSVAVPLDTHGETRGALVLDQSSRALPLLTNRALLGLMLASVAGLLVAGALLFAFATWLSLRIGRLRNAAERAQRREGAPLEPLPLVDDADELGDLARSFSRLLDAIGTYTDYLRTLASKLSHELNTPLAIVKSSLDNLEHADLPADAQPYVARARDGAARLGTIVRAMSEASRMERAIASAEGEDFDLAQVVRGCAEAYRARAAPRRLECVLDSAHALLHGAPELIAQALDKLFDNALSFTPAEGWIRIELRELEEDEGAQLIVANSGPPLPEAMSGRLFDSLVSVRGSGARAGVPHLGLGLYVVRLVAELHQGKVEAHNLADGVAFTMQLRGMMRRRLAE